MQHGFGLAGEGLSLVPDKDNSVSVRQSPSEKCLDPGGLPYFAEAT